ncbi:hypothetical protein [Streptomyces sp. enrichment culture]|uniref:hypothetical protein n=1 Tax=Streptomyces sp. enrichment culture TaxID=1795815 RepID=UPI003F54A455
MKRESASALLQRLYAEGVAPWASRTAAPHPADAPHGAAAPARDGTAGPAPTPDRSDRPSPTPRCRSSAHWSRPRRPVPPGGPATRC